MESKDKKLMRTNKLCPAGTNLKETSFLFNTHRDESHGVFNEHSKPGPWFKVLSERCHHI